MFSCGKQQKNTLTSQVSGVVLCAAGESHSFFVNQNYEVYGCGSNQFGQLGMEGSAIKPTIVYSLKDQRIAQITCGAEHSFMLTTKGEVFAWGLNIKGQLGLGCFENVFNPTLVYSLLPFGSSNGKASHRRMKSDTMDLKERSSSIDNIMEQILMMKEKFKIKQSSRTETTILLQNDEVVASIACGALHTIVLTSKNRILSAGFGEGYALGTEDSATTPEFKQVAIRRHNKGTSPRIEKIERISCGLAHSGCLMDGKPYVWGMMGQKEGLIFKQPTLLKDEYMLDQSIIIDMKMGECFSVFLTSRGEVYSMGDNIDSQLGVEHVGQLERPTKLTSMPLISQIAVGRNHCMALSADLKQLYGWGSNQYGQLNGQAKANSVVGVPTLLFTLAGEAQKVGVCVCYARSCAGRSSR